MTAIYNQPEYHLASSDMQRWAFTHKDNYVSSEEAAKRAGADTSRVVKVKANDGQEHDVNVELKWHAINPVGLKTVRFANGKTYTTAYMIKGASPKNKTAVFFTSEDFAASDDVKKFKGDIDAAFRKFREQHHAMLKAALSKSHAPAAKKAAKELPELAKDGGSAVKKWFAANGFDIPGYVSDKAFDALAKQIAKDGHVSSNWDISAGADGYGHQTGTSGTIDFAAKKIGTMGWSSDD